MAAKKTVNKKALKIINEVKQLCGLLFGNKLHDIYLFGSYARGDYDEESDTWYVITRGDAYAVNDRVPVPVENIQGKIVGANKSLSKVMQFVSKWYGFVTVIAIPLLAIIVWQMSVLIKERSRAGLEKIEQDKQKTIQEIEKEHNEKVELLKKQAIEEYLNKEKEK